MGKLRARTDDELAARREEILESAKKQLMTMDYDDISLATIAKTTSVSRPTMYRYYEKKELVFVDLLVQEYAEFEQELRSFLKRKLSRESFCKKLASLLWNHQVLLKLLSLQLPIWKREYDGQMLKDFVTQSAGYQKTLKDVLEKQFPNASSDARNMFRIQFSVYCNSLYVLEHLPDAMMEAMTEQNVYDSIPGGEETCFAGLMLLSTALEG